MKRTVKTASALLLATALLASFGASLAADGITLADAKRIALTHANAGPISRLITRFTEAKLDDEDGVYELEFRFRGVEYDYEIDAQTGEVREHDSELDDDAPASEAAPASPAPAGQAPAEASATPGAAQPKANAAQPKAAVSLDEAKAIATAHAGVKAPAFTKAHEERDDGRRVYEIEFRADGYEYEYEIDADDGSIHEWDKERDDD